MCMTLENSNIPISTGSISSNPFFKFCINRFNLSVSSNEKLEYFIPEIALDVFGPDGVFFSINFCNVERITSAGSRSAGYLPSNRLGRRQKSCKSAWKQ